MTKSSVWSTPYEGRDSIDNQAIKELQTRLMMIEIDVKLGSHSHKLTRARSTCPIRCDTLQLAACCLVVIRHSGVVVRVLSLCCHR